MVNKPFYGSRTDCGLYQQSVFNVCKESVLLCQKQHSNYIQFIFSGVPIIFHIFLSRILKFSSEHLFRTLLFQEISGMALF
ncbi:hypothetical protein Y032_0257g391 [Ancylostoma ceylanicum]|uniref:Uncharacterized protein n=1 Tax=Ancylostoma ceylanicum TaxID=53326 RepID=A0A016SBL9_9BILA|nr:hypothetical protein Y032_0257g391 [Ancylostoma ceylanicum]